MIKYFLISILLFGLNFIAHAEGPSKISDPRSESGRSSSEYWLEMTQTQPSNLAFFNLAVAYYQEGKLNLSLNSFKKVITAKSSLEPVARFYSAMIYSKKGNNQLAKSLLSPIVIKDLPPNLRMEILNFKNSLYAEEVLADMAEEEAATEQKEVAVEYFVNNFASIDLSYGTNSNPLYYPKTSTTSSDNDTQAQGKFRFGTDILQYSSIQLALDYFYYTVALAKTGDANFDYHDITLPFYFRGEKLNFKIYPEFYTDRYGNSPYSEQNGAGLEMGLQLASSYWGLTFQNLNIKNKTESYSYLSGSTNKYSLFYDKKFSSCRFYTALGFAKYSYQDTSTLASSYNSASIYLSYVYYLGKFDFTLAGSTELKVFAKLATASTNRQDNRVSNTLSIGYYPNRSLKFYLERLQSQSQSNFTDTTTDYDYDQSALNLGFKYYFN